MEPFIRLKTISPPNEHCEYFLSLSQCRALLKHSRLVSKLKRFFSSLSLFL